MAAENRKGTRAFFTKGSLPEWDFVYSVYEEALRLKSQQKRKPEELLKLDSWYQEELPKLIQSRKEKHVTHDELVQTMKWKLSRGKWRPRLIDLVRLNMPHSVEAASRKAFKRLPKLTQAVQALCVLKGVGPATASAVLAAGAPEYAPFMADECLLALPDVESVDYTVQEYLNFAQHLQRVADRLNGSREKLSGKSIKWTPHRVELALWAHYIISELNPSLLEKMPKPEESHEDHADNQLSNGNTENEQEEENKLAEGEDKEENGNDSATKSQQDSDENNQSEDTNDSAPPLKDDTDEPESKRVKTE